jgi:hypothetical protein
MSSKTNAKCYDLEERNYTDGLLSPDVEATYILYLEGSPRYDDINKQLDNFHPTDKVFIVHNQGFKKCDKQLEENNSVYDLIDAYIYALNHAKKNDYENILILEDDFMFDEKIKESKHVEIIKNFLIENKNRNVTYLLGCIPYIQIPLGGYSRVLKSVDTHAVIYNKNSINKLLDNKEKLNDWDIDLAKYTIKYTHNIPLCYQLKTETENYNIWCDKKKGFRKYGCNSVKSVYKTLNLDKSVKSYMFFYNASNILFFIFAISVSIAILFIIFYLKNISL